ncbi:flagellar M-ring protein FliF [Enterobacterales bacterium CwR94]|nr:flagellar M-ring protein FliF [Enterobacterales bacterium CwR94]
MLEKLKQSLAGLPVQHLKKWLLPAAGALAITAVIIALLWQNNQKYTMLFGSQENIPVAQVVEVLTGEQIPYRVDPSTGYLLVREGDISKARMALAGKGISVKTPTGYELMDKEEMLGSSQFIQNVRFKRSMEGELAQSIMSMDAVSFARVHLGISEASSFVLSNKPDSTASVVLRLKYGRELSDDQVAAIVNLVAGSVPGMKVDQVRVVDQAGNLLSSSLAESINGRNVKGNNAVMQRIRAETEQNIANIMAPVVGRENFRVSVVPRIDFSQVEETQERYLGDPKMSSENLNQENTIDQMALGVPGSLSNRPAPANNNANANANANNAAQDNNPNSQASRNQAQRQYTWDRDIRHIRHPGYQIQKLSVAVVVNENAATVKAWSEANQAEITKMLWNAAGIDEQRGDTLTLTALTFNAPPAFEEPVLPWYERPVVIDWAERGGIGLLALLIVLFGLLPMMRRVAANKQTAVAELPAETEGSEPLSAPTFEQLTKPNDADDHDVAKALPGSSFGNDDKLPPQGSGLETNISFLQTLAKDETDRVAEVIKQWINSNERSSSK